LDHVDLAVERIAVVVRQFGRGTVEQQVLELSDTAGRVCDADAVLTAGVLTRRPGVDGGNALPADGLRVHAVLRRGVELRIGAVAGVQRVHLRAAGVGVPRIRVDARDVDGGGELHDEPAAPGARVEKEIRARLVLVTRQQPVVDRGEGSRIRIHVAVDEHQFRLGARVIGHG
jgi:hypothetical protein